MNVFFVFYFLKAGSLTVTYVRYYKKDYPNFFVHEVCHVILYTTLYIKGCWKLAQVQASPQTEGH